MNYTADMLTELSRREKEANIKPDPDIDLYMKVRISRNFSSSTIFPWFPTYCLNSCKIQQNFLPGLALQDFRPSIVLSVVLIALAMKFCLFYAVLHQLQLDFSIHISKFRYMLINKKLKTCKSLWIRCYVLVI